MSATETIRWLVNGIWISSCGRGSKRFADAIASVEETQRAHLLAVLRRNARTRFGVACRFDQIGSVAEYQARVPVTPYEALQPHIVAIAEGTPNVLTAEPVRMFQPTSGTTSGTKLIPWTSAVAAEFRHGIDPWLAALYRRRPELLRGTAYWSISPPGTIPSAYGRLCVGFDQDAGYLGSLGKRLFSLVSAVPPSVANCRDLPEFRMRTLLALLADEHLRLISVWSPTFLTTLLDDCLARQDEIIARLARSGHRGVRRRADVLHALLSSGGGPGIFEHIWPRLGLLSCWSHGSSATYAEGLRHYFPTVEIQGKGLVATEAFVSLPFRTDADPVLAVNSHFFEFQSVQDGALSLAHKLSAGAEYDVVVTTGGGLYRYPLGDRVRVTGFIGGAPCLRFLGRAGLVADRFGEKLHAPFVQTVVDEALSLHRIHARFALLALTEPEAAPPAYALFLATEEMPEPVELALSLETGLASNFHYSHCRHLGQLGPLRLFRISEKSRPAAEVFLDEQCTRGLQLGAVKPAILDLRSGWEKRFVGSFVA